MDPQISKKLQKNAALIPPEFPEDQNGFPKHPVVRILLMHFFRLHVLLTFCVAAATCVLAHIFPCSGVVVQVDKYNKEVDDAEKDGGWKKTDAGKGIDDP